MSPEAPAPSEASCRVLKKRSAETYNRSRTCLQESPLSPVRYAARGRTVLRSLQATCTARDARGACRLSTMASWRNPEAVRLASPKRSTSLYVLRRIGTLHHRGYALSMFSFHRNPTSARGRVTLEYLTRRPSVSMPALMYIPRLPLSRADHLRSWSAHSCGRGTFCPDLTAGGGVHSGEPGAIGLGPRIGRQHPHLQPSAYGPRLSTIRRYAPCGWLTGHPVTRITSCDEAGEDSYLHASP